MKRRYLWAGAGSIALIIMYFILAAKGYAEILKPFESQIFLISIALIIIFSLKASAKLTNRNMETSSAQNDLLQPRPLWMQFLLIFLIIVTWGLLIIAISFILELLGFM